MLENKNYIIKLHIAFGNWVKQQAKFDTIQKGTKDEKREQLFDWLIEFSIEKNLSNKVMLQILEYMILISFI